MQSAIPSRPAVAGRAKFLIGGLLIIAAIVYLIISSTSANAQYFLTISELLGRQSEMTGKDVRISGSVDGNTIQYDANSLTLTFQVANIPGDQNVIDKEGGLAAVLHAAVIDPKAERINVVYKGPKPDLLKNEAQAIMTGQLSADGKSFTATELLLKCPTKYEDAVPNQASQ
jgi:cytochrome c-type biogenesis protein CcmE